MKKNIALVGCGSWGKNILRNLYEIGSLHTVCDKDQKIIDEVRKNFPSVNYISEFNEIFSIKEIEAVVIATPSESHFELAKATLLKDKDTFVEKPLSMTSKEAEELVNLANEKNKILMVGHILHYHHAVIKLKELIDEGQLGKIHYIYSNRLNIGKLRTEENILWSFAPHDVSIILKLVGEEPIKINTSGGDYLNRGVYDTTLTSLEFKNNIKAHIFVSWLHPYKEQKLIVVGDRAMAVFDDTSKEKLFIYPHKIEWKEGKIPHALKADYYTIEVEDKEPLKEELLHFIECVEKRKKPITDGEEGLKVLKILEKAELSLIEKKYIDFSKKDYFVHPSSFIDDGVSIGNETRIWHFSHILRNTQIGKNCIIGQNVVIGPDVKIGDRCKIQNNVSIYKGVTLEDKVFCGPSCVFTNVYNPRAFIERKDEFLPTVVKYGATIGANATIICGVTIGKYAMIGAGAVVKESVADYAIVAGVPAKQIGWACKCGVTLEFSNNYAKCSWCSSEYKLEDNKIFVIKEKEFSNEYA